MTSVAGLDDVSLEAIRRRRIAIVGYGNQGRAQALNLRDSGCSVRIGARPGGDSWHAAIRDGFDVGDVIEVSGWADLVSVLLPDQFHRTVFEQAIGPNLNSGDTILVAHGFSICFGQIQPPPDVDVVLVAPVGPGRMVRRLYVEGHGVPALIAVHQDWTGSASQTALSYATALGCSRAGVIQSTFKEETETDLFGEQAVLCGGVPALIKSGFDTLVAAGYQPEIAYFECVHQVKLMVDLIYEDGIAGLAQRISDTAEFGGYVSGPRVIDEHVKRSMQAVLNDIQDGTFARRWIAEYQAGSPHVLAIRAEDQASDMEKIRARLHAMLREVDPDRDESTSSA